MRLPFLICLFIISIVVSLHGYTSATILLNDSSDWSVLMGISQILFIFFVWTSFLIIAKRTLLDPATLQPTKRAVSWFKGLFVALLVSTIPMTSGCITCVDAGHVGIQVNMAGSGRGVDSIPQVTGWVFYNPLTERIIHYPIFVQTAIWSASPHEGSPNNEEISFNSRKGLIIAADVSLSYRLDPKKISEFYRTFRVDELSTFTHGYLRNVARDAFQELGSKYDTEDIYGNKKDELIRNVVAYINQKVNVYGIIVEQFGFIGAPKLPASIVESLNASQAATQKAIQTENEIRQSEAEAKKNIAVTRGQVEAQLQHAHGLAEARLMAAKSEAESNLLLSKSLTPELLKYKSMQVMEKWDGRRPMVEGGSQSGFIFQLPLGTDNVGTSSVTR